MTKSLIKCFENLRNIKDYGTPYSLNGYGKMMLFILPIALGPYFSHGCGGENCTKNGLGYFYCALYFFLLGSLRRVQSRLENPYDVKKDCNIDIQEEMCEIFKISNKWAAKKHKSFYYAQDGLSTPIFDDSPNIDPLQFPTTKLGAFDIEDPVTKQIHPALLQNLPTRQNRPRNTHRSFKSDDSNTQRSFKSDESLDSLSSKSSEERKERHIHHSMRSSTSSYERKERMRSLSIITKENSEKNTGYTEGFLLPLDPKQLRIPSVRGLRKRNSSRSPSLSKRSLAARRSSLRTSNESTHMAEHI